MINYCKKRTPKENKILPYSTFPFSSTLCCSDSTQPPPLPPPTSTFSLSQVEEDAVSSETEDSDGALKPGPRSNSLCPDRENARDEAAGRRGEGKAS